MSRLRKGALALVATLVVGGFLGAVAPAATAHVGTHYWRVLGPGATGSDVYAVQYMLRAHGYQWVWADGWHGWWKGGVYWTPAKGNPWADFNVSTEPVYRWWMGVQWVPASWPYHWWWSRFWFGTPLNGKYDWRTTLSVARFQWAHGLFPDGVVGPATWQALIVTSSEGSRGPQVRALELLMGHPIDGYFDHALMHDVLTFQHDNGLLETGRADVRTWRALIHH